MGLLSKLFRRDASQVQLHKAPRRARGVEALEERRLLAADVILGSVYYEEATGDDTAGDVLQISFEGGAAGTTLDRIVISGDKVNNEGVPAVEGLSTNDVFFDTTPGDPGAFEAVGYQLISSDGFDVTGVEVIDGGSSIAFTLDGFEAGELLVFSIDVDEAQFVAGDTVDTNSLVEGAEFQRSTIEGHFTAPGHVDLVLDATYWDAFDDNFATEEADAGSELVQLPSDEYDPGGFGVVGTETNNLTDRTAGAVAHAPQLELASISGHVYHDQSDDGVFDPSEDPIADVTVELLDVGGSVIATTTTNAEGYYEFLNLEAGTYGVRETQPADFYDGKDTAGSHGGVATDDLITEVTLDYFDHATDYNFGELLGGSIAGRVHASTDGDCDYDDPDILLEGVVIELLDADGNLLATATTDASGRYRFDDLRPGEYQVRERQPAGYYDGSERAGSAGGTVTDDLVSGIVLGSDEDAVNYDFCEHVGANISGYVYHDRSNDGVKDPGEEAIAGVTLKLLLEDGTDTGQRAVTDTNGYYEFTNLDAGKYRVMEIHPEGWIDGLDTPGTEGGVADNPGDMIREIMVDFGDDAREYNFGELLPGSIAGRVHASMDGDCDYEDPDLLLEGVTIQLLDAEGNLLAETTTDESGEYRFDGLPPAEYQVRELQPAGYYDGSERVGSAGGVLSDDLISGIQLGSDEDAVQYDFCEHVGASLSGHVYHDVDDDGVFDPGEDPIAGVTVELLDASGNGTGVTTTTDANGYYLFSNLNAGVWGVRETQPDAFYDGKDTAGSNGGLAGNDIITGAVLDFGDNATDYDFGELLGGSIGGRVHASTTPDCDFDNPEILLEGVTIQLLDAAGNVLQETTTDANGQYRFDDLRPGEYQIRELQPEGYYDGGEQVGEAGGVASDDLISGILLGSDQDVLGYHFCEHVGANISGYVYHDRSDDGVKDPGEEPIAGVTLKLLLEDGTDTGQRAVTDSNGFYQFSNLDRGTYCVMEDHPEGWIDGLDTPGTEGGVADNPGDMICEITVDFGDDAREYNFGELLPGSISGRVKASPDEDCADHNVGDPLAGVTILLLNESGEVIDSTVTDADGRYSFDDLPPGMYGVREVQPDSHFDGALHVGTGGGRSFVANEIADIDLGSDQDLVHYDFCELPPAGLAGYVFIDGAPIRTSGTIGPEDVADFRDGVRTPDDTPLEGVTIALVNGATGQPYYLAGTTDEGTEGAVPLEALPGFYDGGLITTTTDASGYYEFHGLPAGSYAVVEIGPDGLIDGIDTPGSLGGQAANAGETDIRIEPFREAYGNDVIAGILLSAGDFSVENNFSEVRTSTFFLPPETPVTPPPPVFLPTITVAPPVAPTPPTPIEVAPESIFGGGSGVGYTWHLSVINSGRPWEFDPEDPRALLASTEGDPEWSGADRSVEELRRAQWLLLASDVEGAELSEFLLGDEEAIPVAGDWNGDGVTDIGVFIAGDWYLDLNGDGRWDRNDLWAKLGTEADLPVTGDWDGDGKTDIGIFGPAWPRDPHAVERDPGMVDAANQPGPLAGKMKNPTPTEEDATLGARLMKRLAESERRVDLIDHVFHFGSPTDTPVAGDWNGDGIRNIGVFNNGGWVLDTDGDGRLTDADRRVELGAAGDTPVVGDFDGDGVDELGVYRDGAWLVDANGDGDFDATDEALASDAIAGRIGVPIAGDWDGDGADEPGVFQPGAGDGEEEPTARVSRRAQ